MSSSTSRPAETGKTVFTVLGAASFCHMLNDTMQSLLPAIYPLLKAGFGLSFGQIGILTLAYQITASLLQPLIGLYTDKRPQPYSLPVGMMSSFLGLLTIAVAPHYAILLLGAGLLGIGSSIFHPEASRLARLASGGAHGLAQSVFQVGGTAGTALGPLLAAFFILPRGQISLAWFACVALLGAVILSGLGRWYKTTLRGKQSAHGGAARVGTLSRGQISRAMAILIALVFSKYFYLTSITSYYIFYLMHRFGLSVRTAQIDLFIFLAAAAVGTMAGGPIGDRIGRKQVIWGSIGGVLPFTVALPYVGLQATILLSVPIGLILASAFSAIVVYAQELLPGRVGMVSGLFFGLAFGMGGIGAGVLGVLADRTSIDIVYQVCAWLPAIGFLAILLPPMDRIPQDRAA